jgi:hypothetical protein
VDVNDFEDLQFERRMWVLQRFGWGLVAAIVGAALAGFFGPGPVSTTTAVSSDGTLRVSYLRFARSGGVAGMDVEADGRLVRDGELLLAVDQNLLSHIQIEQMTPEPREALAADGRTVFVFAVAGAPETVTLDFDLRPSGMGGASGLISVLDGPSVQVSQFFYP